jgi:hypothetical protein
MTLVDKNIDIEEDACTVTCKPVGGNVSAKRNQKLKWTLQGRATRFKIDFYVQPVDGFQTPPAPWPFGDHPPPGQGDNSTGWITSGKFEGWVAYDEGVFEYHVIVPCPLGDVLLDPMIIVRP